MAVSNNVGAIEETVLKTPAVYRYNEVISKSFPATAGQQSWKQKDIFNKEPFDDSICRSDAFNGTNTQNPILYRKFNLNEVIIYRNGSPPLARRCQQLIINNCTTTQWLH